MLKKLFLTLACLPLALACLAAQLTATLQSGDNLTPFYGDNSFVEAYAAAADGDIITLSPGQFNGVDTIAKSIKVIGSYAFDEKASVSTIFANKPTIKASDVWVEGIRFTNSVNIKATDQLTFSRCYIQDLSDQKGDSITYHTNTRLVDCAIPGFGAMEYSDNLVLQNCCIESFYDKNDKSKLAYIENCQIRYWYFNGKTSNNQPYAIYKNCFIGIYSFNTKDPILNIPAPTELHDTILLMLPFSTGNKVTVNTDNCNTSNIVQRIIYDRAYYPELSFNPYTYNGISYGPIDHKDYPAIPVVTSSEIDSKTDAVGNLHVKINAEVRD